MNLQFHARQRFWFRFATKRRLHGVAVGVNFFTSDDEERRAFERVEDALRLIGKFAPRRLSEIQSDVASIFVSPFPSSGGCFIRQNDMVLIDDAYAVDEETTSEAIACLLVHEAQHARLFRLGFDYEEPVRGRIERICHRAERNFARLLPDSEWLVEHAEEWMEATLKHDHSTKTYWKSHTDGVVDRLRDLDCPEWIIKAALWYRSRRNS